MPGRGNSIDKGLVWEDRSWQVPCGWSSGGKGGRAEVGMGCLEDTEEIGPYLKPWGGMSQLCRHLPKHHHRDGICDDCDRTELAGRA